MTGDIVFARTGATVGKSFLIKELPFDSVYASYLIRIRVIGKLSRDYVYDFFNSKCYWNQITDKSVGVGQPNCNGSSLKELLIPVPPINEQELIIKSIKNLQLYSNIIESQQTDLKSLLLKCKSKILDLAIRGKLVSQDPNDEPASKLLERIRHEKEELIKAGKLKRDKRESVIFRGEDNSYYLRTGKLVEPLTDWSFDNLPTNWEICCFGEICNYGDCINTESSVIENSAWILDLEDIEKDTGRIISRVSKADRPSISTKHKFHKGQVLYSKLRPYLNKVVLADRDGYCTSEILPLEFHAEIIPEYARYYLMSPTFLRYADKCSYGVKMPRLGTNDGKKAIFPLPPVNEQKRIVKQIEFMFSHLSVIETSVQ
ncbi:type I restriction enzyme, S subunit [Ruminobacter amylophilus]|uniref:Type I restriction enzyme, S subunit n=2 Tax=Ruminobacter amylophilus TaxID=867 RepID=A0A662ZKK9_9GAMM|nr:type I restriction enzyme, S subunit [Ruminobacter amylophilus]